MEFDFVNEYQEKLKKYEISVTFGLLVKLAKSADCKEKEFTLAFHEKETALKEKIFLSLLKLDRSEVCMKSIFDNIHYANDSITLTFSDIFLIFSRDMGDVVNYLEAMRDEL